MLIFKKLTENGFARQVSVLASGTAIAHLLALGTLPLITRLYTPEQFGILGVFVAFMSILSVVANWRYEIAIPLPESDERAANLAAVALVCGLVTTGLTFVFVYFVGNRFAEMTKFSRVADYLWLLPAGVFLTAAYAVFQYWATRKKAFIRVARTRVEQAVGGVGTQLITGWMGFGTIGLILGQIVNNGAGFLGLARRAYSEDRALLAGVKFVEMKSVAREYDRFPKYSVLESLSNISAVQVPLILIGSFAASSEVGYLMLGMRLMQAPVGLIGSSISQVFFVQAVDSNRNGSLHNLLNKTLSALLRTGVGPLIFSGIVAPSICGPIFGDGWGRAGELVAWMTPWFVFQFLAQPVSMVLHVTSNQRSALLLQFLGLLLRVGSVLIPIFFWKKENLSEAYALSGAIFYLIYLLTIVRAGGGRIADLGVTVARSSFYIFGWCALAGAVVTALSFV